MGTKIGTGDWRSYILLPHQQPAFPLKALIAAICICASLLYLPLGMVCFALYVYVHIVLRPPSRPDSDQLPGRIVAPITGGITRIEFDAARAEAKIHIAPHWFDCHLIYPPISAFIERVETHVGDFSRHRHNRVSPKNARREIVFQGTDMRVTLTQYASLWTRFLLCFTQEGHHISLAESCAVSLFRPVIGVTFSSASPPLHLYQGQRCISGQTILNA